MPIYKLKKISDLDESIKNGKVPGEFTFKPDEKHYRKILLELNLLMHIDLPRGVHKFKTLEEADRWLMKALVERAVQKAKLK